MDPAKLLPIRFGLMITTALIGLPASNRTKKGPLSPGGHAGQRQYIEFAPEASSCCFWKQVQGVQNKSFQSLETQNGCHVKKAHCMQNRRSCKEHNTARRFFPHKSSSSRLKNRKYRNVMGRIPSQIETSGLCTSFNSCFNSLFFR